MKKAKRMFTILLAFALLLSCTAGYTGSITTARAASTKKKTKAYILSKKAGTYTEQIKVKLTARKGYKVYYTTTGKFSTSKVLKANKSKNFTIKKTTTLSLYAVKKTKKITKAKLKTKTVKKAAAKYVYKIKKNNTESSTVTVAPTATPSVKSTASPTATSDTTPTPTMVPGGNTPPAPPSNPPGGSDNTSGGSSTEAPSTIQESIDNAAMDSETAQLPSATSAPVEYNETSTRKLTLTQDTVMDNQNSADSSYEVKTIDGSSVNARKIVIQKSGTYILTGGTSSNPIQNIVIQVAKNMEETVNLVLDNLNIDNHAMGTIADEDLPVISVEKGTTNVTVTLVGTSKITGNGQYTSEPASGIIYAKDGNSILTFMASSEDANASLTVEDGMSKDTEYNTADPTDGIFAKGTLLIQSGTYTVTSNGDCLKATGSSGEGGVAICNGTFELNSRLGNGIRSKSGNVVIQDGKINMDYTAADGINAKNYQVSVSGGEIHIENCCEDGIQGETVYISGEDTLIDISTCYANAGKNFYDSSLGSGNYNTLSSTDSTKKETINIDTGSHKAIKAGTKACTYEYTSVTEDSDYTAGTVYTTEASGGLYIMGGILNLDTTKAGIKYNGGSSMGGGSSMAAGDSATIIGSPDDTIHSNNICVISGATLNLASSDDGITSATKLIIRNNCNIAIETCYEGMESGEIYVGSQSDSEDAPEIKIYSNDDGINASSKSSVHYVYADESETKYTKTETSASNNNYYMLAGYVGIMIGDDTTHSFSLPVEGAENTTGSYSSNGDGIDCNGSFFAYGGTIIVFGSTQNDNSPIDTDNTYYIGSGVTLLAAGSSGMMENPTSIQQACVTYGGSSSRPGGKPGPSSPGSSTSSISSGSILAIQDGNGNTVLTLKAPKTLSYILFSSPELISGSSYNFYRGGSAQTLLLENWKYDCRYTGYDVSGATSLTSVTATM